MQNLRDNIICTKDLVEDMNAGETVPNTKVRRLCHELERTKVELELYKRAEQLSRSEIITTANEIISNFADGSPITEKISDKRLAELAVAVKQKR